MTDKVHTNLLIHAQSPYLLQHAHNPVNWVEWTDAIFENAKAENKLIIVSIGYSACHWCHVMEHESFEKEDTADIMNRHFICVKVDREERPDVDQVYMDALQLLTGQGGWPLNMICLPDGRPLHGGTYFPKAEWERMLKSINDFWQTKPEEAMEHVTNLSNGVKKLDLFVAEPNANITTEIVDVALESWKKNFDLVLGGYNWSPKFPMPNNWQLFLQYSNYTKDEVYLNAVNKTLTAMANGGIYDQIGGGFARYSTDSFWKAPHFEKMLYDNAQLIEVYSKAFAATKNPLYKTIVDETINFIATELTNHEGLFYSALDADSEGVEGKYYIWTRAELTEILGADEPLFSLYYSVDAYGNWEHGANILYKTRSIEELEKLTGKTSAQIEEIVSKCKTILLVERNKRIKPGLDDKTICSWNAQTIKALAEAYLVFDNEAYLQMAEKAVNALLKNLYVNKKLYRIYKNGKNSIEAFAEDFSLLIEALIKLYQASGKEDYLLRANALMQQSITQFYDENTKLFYFKSKTDKVLITRKIDVNDDVIPSANSVFANCLWQLGFYFSEDKYHKMAEEMVLMVQHKIEKFPSGFSNWMSLILLMTKPYYQVVVSGENAIEQYKKLTLNYLPNCLFALVQSKSKIPLLADKQPKKGALIYVCVNKTCGLPVKNVEEAFKQIVF